MIEHPINPKPALTPQEGGVLKIIERYGSATFDAGPDVDVDKLIRDYNCERVGPPLANKPTTLQAKSAV